MVCIVCVIVQGGDTVLMHAVRNNNKTLVQDLIAAGANTAATDKVMHIVKTGLVSQPSGVSLKDV